MAKDLASAYDALAHSPALLDAFRAQYHGDTRAMAQALGVSQRSVQRYYAEAGKQQRAPSTSTRARMAASVPVEGRVQGEFFFDTPGFRDHPDTRQRDITFRLEPDQMQDVFNALLAGDAEMASVHFFEAYGMAAPDAVIGADYAFSFEKR